MRFIIATNHAWGNWGNFRDAQTTVQSEEIRRTRGSVRDDARQFHVGKTQRHRERETMYTGNYGKVVPCRPQETTAVIRQFDPGPRNTGDQN